MDGILINKMLKPTIISISMATVMAGAAISPALGLIAKAFPDASPTMIKLILTAPSIIIIPFSFLSSYLTSKMTKRTIILIGLIIYLIGGVGPQFVSSIEMLIGLRLFLGAGVGLVMPLSMSLINDYFKGKERTQMMGYNSAFSNFGGIITMLLAGWLATFGWRTPFNVYFLGLFIFILIFLVVTKGEIQKPLEHSSKTKFPLDVWGYALDMGGIMLAYYSIATNMVLFLDENNIGGASIAGVVVAFTTVGGMITSLFLVQLEFTLKRFIMPVMLAGMALAFFTLSFTNSLPLVLLSVTLVGFGQGSLFPVIVLKVLDRVVPYHSDRAVAITSSFTFLGQFASPLVLDSVGRLAGITTIRFQYGFLAIEITIIVLINFFIVLKNNQAKPSH